MCSDAVSKFKCIVTIDLFFKELINQLEDYLLREVSFFSKAKFSGLLIFEFLVKIILLLEVTPPRAILNFVFVPLW